MQSGGAAGPPPGDLRLASSGELLRAAQQDGYARVEDWKVQELQLNSRDQILIDRNGNLYSAPRRGPGAPQPLNVRVPR